MTIKQHIKEVDCAGVPYTPTFNQQTHYRTFPCGILSIILWIVIILISVDKLVSILSKKQMLLTSLTTKTSQSITLNDLNLNLVVQTSQNTVITKDNQFEYGLNLTYSTYKKPQNGTQNVQNQPLQSQSYNFYLPASFSPEVSGSVLSQNQQNKYFQIQIRFCDQEVDPQCQKISTTADLNIKLTWDRPILSLKKGQQLITMQNIQEFKTIQMQSLDENTKRKIFYMEGLSLELDESVFPSVIPFTGQSEVKSWYYDFATAAERLNIVENATILQSYSFRRQDISTQYERRYKKIDTGIAEILGIFSLVSLIFFTCSSHYKNWAKNILLTESVTNRQLQPISMSNYIKYVRNQNDERQELDEEVQKTTEKLDIVRLRQEVDKLKDQIERINYSLRIPNPPTDNLRMRKEKEGDELKESLLISK